MVHVRTIAPHDLEAVMGLENAVPEAPHWTRAVYDRFLTAEPHRKRIFVAEEGGSLLGFLAAQINLDVCELDSVVVNATDRRSGVGRALLHALFDWAANAGSVRVQLEVRCTNMRAINFYISSGFICDGLRPAYYRDPEEDAMLMSRALEPTPNHKRC